MLHDRFYSAWIQPTTNVAFRHKNFDAREAVRIEKDGRVSKFEIAKPSGNATVNESVSSGCETNQRRLTRRRPA